MDEAAVADLKQFLATTVRTMVREEVRIVVREEITDAITASEARMTAKIDEAKEEILTAVADTMQRHIDNTDERFENHEKRLKKLEHQPA